MYIEREREVVRESAGGWRREVEGFRLGKAELKAEGLT